MIKGLLSLIGLFVGAAIVLFAFIFMLHRLWVFIKGDRDLINMADSLKISMMIFAIVVVSFVIIIKFVL